MLWPFALVTYSDTMNYIHADMNGKTPNMKFLDTGGSTTRIINFHTFGCPVYILDDLLKPVAGGCTTKWDPPDCLGIYLGRSPSNSGSVALFMNPNSGLVYPQFHLVFDDNFETVPHLQAGTVPKNWPE